MLRRLGAFTALSLLLVGCGGDELIPVGGVAPDFALADVNESSPRAGAAVSPRDYLEQVSGWYFGHAT